MWKVMLFWLIPSVCYAGGLSDIANGAGPIVGPFLYCIAALVIVASVGGAGHIILNFCDNPKMIKMVDKGTYISLLGIVIGMGLTVITNLFSTLAKFIQFVCG